jgi:hypothetical protein
LDVEVWPAGSFVGISRKKFDCLRLPMAYSSGRTVASFGELITLQGRAKRLSRGYGEGQVQL